MNVALTSGVASTTVAWFTLAGAIGGVLVTGLVSLTTAMLNHRWQSEGTQRQLLQDHNTLVRQERQESYAAYWLAWNRFTHEIRKLRDRIQELPSGTVVNRRIVNDQRWLDYPEVISGLQELIDKTWDAELEWQAAADTLLLVADPEVEQAANTHITMTREKLAAAWEGKSHHDQNGAASHSLTDAMRAALLTPVSPEAWLRRGPAITFGVLSLRSRAIRSRFRL